MNEKNDIDMLLRERYVSDLRKPEIDNKERALILKRVMEVNGWSIRELATQFGFKNSTVQDWLLWDDGRVEIMRSEGFSDTEIYRVLRNNKPAKIKKLSGVSPAVTVEAVRASATDERLRTMACEVKRMLSDRIYSDTTRDRILSLVNECNRFDSFIKLDIAKHGGNGNGNGGGS